MNKHKIDWATHTEVEPYTSNLLPGDIVGLVKYGDNEYDQATLTSKLVGEGDLRLALEGSSVQNLLVAEWQLEWVARPVKKATVTLFKSSGKYYTDEEWRIPPDAVVPADMINSLDFRRLSDGGAVLVPKQEPWGYPHLFPNDPPEPELDKKTPDSFPFAV